jgi:HEAT repeat protein
VDKWITHLSSDDQTLRMMALSMLRLFGDLARPALPALKQHLTDDDPYFRLSVAGAIGAIAPEDTEALPVLIEGLSSPVALNRATACEFIGERRNKSVVLNVTPLLHDDEFIVRFAAAKAIGRTFNNWLHAIAMCIGMLKNADESKRAIGASALFCIRRHAKRHVDLLRMAIVDAPWDVRLDIEEVIGVLSTV